MSRKMLALVVAVLAMYNAVQAQEPGLFPAPNSQPWELPTHPMDPRVNSEGTPQNSNVPSPYYSDPMFKTAMPGARGYVPQGIVAEAMGVRTEANSWLHENLHPGMLPPAPETAQPLIYRPVYSVLGSSDAAPHGLTVPVASRASGPVDTPDAANPSPLPPSWNILTSPEVPLPPELAPAPVPPVDDFDRKHADKKQHAMLMEIQAKTQAKQREQQLQSQAAELARLRAAAAAKPVPVRTVTTTTYYSNPYVAGAMHTTFDRQPSVHNDSAIPSPPKGPLTDAAPAKLQEKSITSFVEKDGAEDEDEAPAPAPMNRVISYNRFKKAFDVHTNPESGSSAYERAHNGNPSETQTQHLPNGWHEATALTEAFAAAHGEADVHESAYLRARQAAEAAALNKAAPAAPAAANETEAKTEDKEEEKEEEKASFMETDADAEAEGDDEDDEDDDEDKIEDNTDAVYHEFKPRHTAPTNNHRRLNGKELHYRKQLIRDAIAPIVATPIVHEVIPLRQIHVPHHHHHDHMVITHDDIRRAPAVPAPGSFLPKTKMGMLSEFIHAAKNQRFGVTSTPFDGSMLQTDEAASTVVSSRKPYGTPKFASMRSPPQ